MFSMMMMMKQKSLRERIVVLSLAGAFFDSDTESLAP